MTLRRSWWANLIAPAVALSLVMVTVVAFAVTRGNDNASERVVATQPDVERVETDDNQTPQPSVEPTELPIASATASPTAVIPTAVPTPDTITAPIDVTATPEVAPTPEPPAALTATAVVSPTETPAAQPNAAATTASTETPVAQPTAAATVAPTETSTAQPTTPPTATPTPQPTAAPTTAPTEIPTTQSSDATIPAVSRGRDFAWNLTATSQAPSPAVLFDAPEGSPIAPVYVWPDGSTVEYEFYAITYYGNAATFQVVQGAPGDTWAEVLLPTRPTGTTAWMQTTGWDWHSSDVRITVSLSNRTLQLFKAGTMVFDAPVSTGSATRPTPPMTLGYIDEIVDVSDTPRGPYDLSLSLFTDTMAGSSAGVVPKVAIRGTASESLEGDTAGSITVTRPTMLQLIEHVAAGTIVEIVP